MWSKGILTDEIKHNCIKMLDSDFGIDIWSEAGEKVLAKRRKVLDAFKKKISSPQSAPKKITVNLHLKSVFNVGDIIAIQLQTKDKTFLPESVVSEEFFRDCDGKYVVIKKVEDNISYQSSLVPEVADHWIVYKLYDKLFDYPPTLAELENVGWAKVERGGFVPKNTQTFVCESSMFYFKKRRFKVLGSDSVTKEEYAKSFNSQEFIFFSINAPHYNADTLFINAILKK